jgi:hypothetical protein
MRTLIIKAVLRAISVFIIIYFIILGFQYVGWEKERKAYFLEHPVRTEPFYGTVGYEEMLQEQRMLHFYPDLWPFKNSWAMGLWYKFTQHI